MQTVYMPSYLATQIDIISSDRVARRVVRLLGLEKVPGMVDKWKEDSEGVGTFEGILCRAPIVEKARRQALQGK